MPWYYSCILTIARYIVVVRMCVEMLLNTNRQSNDEFPLLFEQKIAISRNEIYTI